MVFNVTPTNFDSRKAKITLAAVTLCAILLLVLGQAAVFQLSESEWRALIGIPMSTLGLWGIGLVVYYAFIRPDIRPWGPPSAATLRMWETNRKYHRTISNRRILYFAVLMPLLFAMLPTGIGLCLELNSWWVLVPILLLCLPGAMPWCMLVIITFVHPDLAPWYRPNSQSTSSPPAPPTPDN